VHKPAEQKNSTSRGSRWHSDWRWLHPFSSAVTLDENRAVLPPLRTRPNVYTYYDPAAQKTTKAESEADRQLLIVWRRAWFSKGFRPVVLGPLEARNNPLFESFQSRKLKIDPGVTEDLRRWMAWGSMDTGIFVDWLAYPMAPYDDKFMSYLRKFTGEVEKSRIIMWQKGSTPALLAGERSHVNQVIKAAIDNVKLTDAKSIIDLLPDGTLNNYKSNAIALYDAKTIKPLYPGVAKKILAKPVEGKQALKFLINSHLQTVFQNTFGSGLNVIQPFPRNASILSIQSMRLANLLAECADSPIPKSCPPNQRSCTPCSPSSRMTIEQKEHYVSDKNAYTLGAVPHPYALTGLLKHDLDFSVAYLRRNTTRDNWVTKVSKDLVEHGGVTDLTRLVAFKDIIAGDDSFYRNLFFTLESFPNVVGNHNLPEETLQQLEWHFGFIIPRRLANERDVDVSKALKPAGESQGHWDEQFAIAGRAREVVRAGFNGDELSGKEKEEMKPQLEIKASTEAWNIGDTEIWKFARAY
ncbi:hypothetical protein KEM54_001247, partial [Ascosphaera aggregata]